VSDIPDQLVGSGGTRLAWEAVPLPVRARIEHELGSSVTFAQTAEMGFSPALAALLRLDGGREVFAKAIGPDHLSGAPGGQDLYRREARIARRLPAGLPAPRLLATLETNDWVVLLFEPVRGRHPVIPWSPPELETVLNGIDRLGRALTPAPLSASPLALPGGSHWPALRDDPRPLDALSWLDPWVLGQLDWLSSREEAFAEAAAGSTLAHTDIRADNVLLADEGAVFVDWPHSAIAAPWIDLLYFLPSVAMQGGPNPNETFWAQPQTRGIDQDAVITVVAGIAGFFAHGATQRPPPGLPRLRGFQAAQGRQAVRWLRQLVNRTWP
jgi:hypothetical protein